MGTFHGVSFNLTKGWKLSRAHAELGGVIAVMGARTEFRKKLYAKARLGNQSSGRFRPGLCKNVKKFLEQKIGLSKRSLRDFLGHPTYGNFDFCVFT